jgi:multidrug efflux pump subunit AcrA (membrane-fusion protein)
VGVALTGEAEPSRKGHLDFLDNRLDQASGTIRARAIIENADGLLTPGLFGRIRIPGSSPIAVSSSPTRRSPTIKTGASSTSSPRMGPCRRDRSGRALASTATAVIREGLTGDETVVVNGLMRVRAGQRVSPQPVTLPPTRARVGS